jgi:propanediol dehydratase small subunit
MNKKELIELLSTIDDDYKIVISSIFVDEDGTTYALDKPIKGWGVSEDSKELRLFEELERE